MKALALSATLVALLILAIAASVMSNGAEVVPPATSGEGAGPTISPAVPPTPPVQRTWTTDQLITMTVAEAWQFSGKDYNTFVAMVRDAANLSMQKRGLVIPDTKEAGNEIGCMIRQRAQADPNQLLYVVVDSSLRDYVARHPLPAQPPVP